VRPRQYRARVGSVDRVAGHGAGDSGTDLLRTQPRGFASGGVMNTLTTPLKGGTPHRAQQRRRRRTFTPARLGVYAFLLTAALFFLLPLYVMLVTSVKPMSEIRLGNLLAFPAHFTLDAWSAAWQSACTGLDCTGIRVGFWNSVRIVVPRPSLSIAIGAVNGYALSFWKPRGAGVLFGVLLMGAFIPVQVMIYPLVRV